VGYLDWEAVRKIKKLQPQIRAPHPRCRPKHVSKTHIQDYSVNLKWNLWKWTQIVVIIGKKNK
jgi:hypothetical protein